MRKIFFLFCAVVLFIPVSAQTPSKVKIQNTGSGKIAVVRRKTRSIIDLSKNISGCPYISGSQKRILNKQGCAAPPATIKLVDAVIKKNLTFLVVQSDAAGSCNICGQCRTHESFSLIWLKLDARLRVLDKKSVMIEDCAEKIYLLTPELDFDEQTQTAKQLWNNDAIVLEFEKSASEGTEVFYQFTHLEYNRKTPERGFVIKTERRARSSAQQQ